MDTAKQINIRNCRNSRSQKAFLTHFESNEQDVFFVIRLLGPKRFTLVIFLPLPSNQAPSKPWWRISYCTSTRTKVQTLANWVHRRTQTNCFFVHQLLHALVEFDDNDSFIFLRDNNITQQALLPSSHDMVELVRTRIQKLPSRIRNVLSAASCFGGGPILLELVEIATRRDDDNNDDDNNSKNTNQALEAAEQMALIRPWDGGSTRWFFHA